MEPEGWMDTTIGELCDKEIVDTQTGPFGSQLHKHDYVESGIPVIPTEAIGRRLLRSIEVPMVGQETADRLARHKVRVGDILFARRGVQATGLSAIMRQENQGWICGTGAILLRTLTDEIDPTFLSFVLSSESSFHWLRQHAVGAVMPNLNKTVIRGLPIKLPSLPEQKVIASILGALDDKIELNRRMDATLESLARAIFKSWFVGFDPVRWKAEGTNQQAEKNQSSFHLPPATLKLFPSTFQDSELGKIPEGWAVEKIGKAVEAVGGSTPSTKKAEYWEGGTLHWATPKDLSGLGSPFILDTSRKITDAGANKISSGVLPAGVLLLSSRAPVGYLAIAQVPVAINQGFIAMKPNSRASGYYLLNWCRENMWLIESRASGTTFQEISKSNFRPIPMLLPPEDLVSKFTKVVGPLYSRIVCNLRESETLGAVRDTLLPKLLSGQLRVPDAVKQVAKAI